MAKITQADIEDAARDPLKYFSHDSHAAEDTKCRRLLRRCGMEGYGRWWRLCELLAAEEGHHLSVADMEDEELLAESLFFDGPYELEGFLDTLTDCGLILMPGDGFISAQLVTDASLYFGKKRASGGKGGSNRGNKGV
ncbi:MAG: DUF4373 domain-containing protein [Gordonibacter sp.]|uniref:Lin1244/Lin1753 domain-containing protein n=1 Tax=Gordonibacter sp. TaxID=1968902 RepID=UPI002FC69D5B